MAESEVKTKLTVEKGGETGAFAETADEVRDLGTAAAAADVPLDQLEGGLNEVATSADKAAAAVDGTALSLEKAATAAGEGKRTSVEAAGGMSEAGDAYGEAGPKVESTGQSFASMARQVQRSITIVREVHEALGVAEDALGRLGKAAGLTGDEFKGLGDWMPFASRNVETLSNAWKNADTILRVFSSGSLEELQTNLIAADNAIKGLNPNVDKAGAGLNQLADSSKKSLTGIAEHNEAIKKAETAYASWLGKMDLAKPKLTEAATDLTAFVQRFLAENGKIAALPEPVARKVAEMLAALKTAGVQVPPELAKIAAAWGIVDTAVAKTVAAAQKATTDLETTLKQAANAVAAGLPAEMEKAKANVQGLVDATRLAGQQISPEVANVAAQLGVMVGEYETLGNQTEMIPAGSQAVVSGFRLVRDAAGNITGMISDLGQKSGDAATKLSGVGTAVEGTATQTKAAATEFGAAATEVGKSTKALEGVAPAAKTAADDLSGAKTASEGLATSQNEAGTAVKNTEQRLGELETKLGAVETAISNLASKPVPALDFSLWDADLDRISAKINKIRGDLEAMANVTGGSSSVPVNEPN